MVGLKFLHLTLRVEDRAMVRDFKKHLELDSGGLMAYSEYKMRTFVLLII